MNIKNEQHVSGYTKYGAMINFDELDMLIGQLLTYIDATYTDLEQRKAHKSIVKNLARNWYRECQNNYPVMAKLKENASHPNDVEYANWDQKENGTTI